MHQGEIPAAGIGLLPGEGVFKQDGAAVQEIIARRVILIDSNAYILETGCGIPPSDPGAFAPGFRGKFSFPC